MLEISLYMTILLRADVTFIIPSVHARDKIFVLICALFLLYNFYF
jgi:hypothetical protein